MLVFRVRIYYEVVIRGVGEHARGQAHRRPATIREVPLGELPEHLFVVVVGLAVDLVGAPGLVQVEVRADFPQLLLAIGASRLDTPGAPAGDGRC